MLPVAGDEPEPASALPGPNFDREGASLDGKRRQHRNLSRRHHHSGDCLVGSQNLMRLLMTRRHGAERSGVALLTRGRCGTGEWMAPAEIVPIIDMASEGRHVRLPRQLNQNGVSRWAGRVALRAEELDNSQRRGLSTHRRSSCHDDQYHQGGDALRQLECPNPIELVGIFRDQNHLTLDEKSLSKLPTKEKAPFLSWRPTSDPAVQFVASFLGTRRVCDTRAPLGCLSARDPRP